ncbi:MAG: DUF4157 domain-containing protein [Enhygromyxa sp.]
MSIALLQRKPALERGDGGPARVPSGRRANHNPRWHQLALRTPGVLQAKLEVGAANDRYEQEADRVADQVMSASAPVGEAGTSAPLALQRKCLECEQEEVQRKPIEDEGEDETVQAKHAPAQATPPVSAETGSRISALRGRGEPMPGSLRAFFEPRLGVELGSVRLHTDPEAAVTARQLGARAFTIGRDVVFGPGQYDPQSTAGRRLLAHELVHVRQQNQGLRSEQVIQRDPELNVTSGTTPELQSELRRLISEQSARCSALSFSDECSRYASLISTLRERIRNRGNPTTADCPISLDFDGRRLSITGSGRASFPAVSGAPINGRFDYSAERQRMPGVGPIPAGTYWLDPAELTGLGHYFGSAAAAWGTHRISIHPFHSTHTFGRGGFFIHGGSTPGSAGCIDLTGAMAAFAAQIRGYRSLFGCKIILRVNYPIGPGDFPPPGPNRAA